MNDQTSTLEKSRTIRWWPAQFILAAAVVAFVILWIAPHDSQQSFNIHVAQVVLITFALLLVWVTAFSRMRWQARCGIFGLIVVMVVSVGTLFKIHGVNGNLIPILEPRWAHREFEKPVATMNAIAEHATAPGAADFPQFLGPMRDGRLPGPKLATNWTEQPPALLWRVPVGTAWSGFAVAGSIAITQEQRGDDECVVAYELTTGKIIWSHADPKHYANSLAGEGPRATPTVVNQRVLTQGAMGLLNCLNLADGKVLWSKEVLKDNGSAVPTWGEAISPLVLDDLVIVSGGPDRAALAAYRLAEGSVTWSSGTLKEGGYSSPLAATFAGTRQIILFADNITGSDVATGKTLWQFLWPGGHPHVAEPVIASDNEVIVSSGYGTGSARLKVEHDAAGQWTVKQVWRTNRMKAKFTDLILQGEFLYGLDDGIMECLDANTGALAWKDGKYGHGQILLVGDVLLIMAESGEVILVNPQPDQLYELTRFAALKQKTWNPPALAGEYLIVRNDKEAACFRLPVSK